MQPEKFLKMQESKVNHVMYNYEALLIIVTIANTVERQLSECRIHCSFRVFFVHKCMLYQSS